MFDGEILFEELKVIREILTSESKSSYTILNSLMTFNCFPNACLTYRIILTIYVLMLLLHLLEEVFRI